MFYLKFTLQYSDTTFNKFTYDEMTKLVTSFFSNNSVTDADNATAKWLTLRRQNSTNLYKAATMALISPKIIQDKLSEKYGQSRFEGIP